MKKNNTNKDQLKGNISAIRTRIFSKKVKFHNNQALLPFPEKIKILKKLQQVAQIIKHSGHSSWHI